MTKGKRIEDVHSALPVELRWRARKIAQGLCPSCGKDKNGAVTRFCDVCQAKHNARQLRAYYARKAREVGK